MKRKNLVVALVFNLICLSLFYSSDCFQFVQRRAKTGEHESVLFRNTQLQRQAPIMPPVLAGPLALAAFLFALPLLPSLVMAPLALAGIPPALNTLSTILSSLTNGKPLNSLLMPFSDPLQATETSSIEGQPGQSYKPASASSQLGALKNIAKLFRTAIGKRYSANKINLQEVVPDKVVEEIEEEDSLTPNMVTNLTETQGNQAQMEKSLKNMNVVLSSIKDIYSVIRNGLRRYEITDTDCQSRIVCEIHQKIISHNKLLKSFSLNALDVLGLEKHVESWSALNQKSKQTIKFYINAAKVGFADKDCNKEFDNCPTLYTRSVKLKNLIFPHIFIPKL